MADTGVPPRAPLIELTSFVGSTGEIREVVDRLRGSRLVTLTGVAMCSVFLVDLSALGWVYGMAQC